MSSKIERETLEPKVCVLGDGAWGTAIATVLAQNGFEVNLWCYNAQVADSINKHNINNLYFPDLVLDKKIKAFTDINQAIKDSSWIFEAIPVKFLRTILNQITSLNKEQKWVVLSKGLEQKTFLLPSQIIDDVFKYDVKKIVVSGPSFAHDLVQKKFTCVEIAGSNDIANQLIPIMQNDYFKLNYVDDLIGVQVGGAFKNVVTIALGIADGLGYSDNTKAYIFTKGLHEIAILAKHLGGKGETVYGLSGAGDLVLSAFGKHSKNLNLGLNIAKGLKVNELQNLPEGINTLQSAYELIKANDLKLPLIYNLYKIIFSNSDFSIIL